MAIEITETPQDFGTPVNAPVSAPRLITEVEGAMNHAKVDVRHVYATIPELLGVNIENEMEVIHGVLCLLIKAVLVGKPIEEVTQMINEMKGKS